jgi:hypothetical protein
VLVDMPMTGQLDYKVTDLRGSHPDGPRLVVGMRGQGVGVQTLCAAH